MSYNEEKNGIVLNRMYVGDYLATNLGHEVINLFKADNGKHYIYLNATGNFSNVHSDKIGYMLFVKYHVDGAIEVIGMAKGLSDIPGANKTLHRDIVYKGIDDDIWQLQKNYIDAQTNKQGEKVGISYGGVPILDIFKGSKQQSILITYEAKNVYKPCKRIFIRYSNVDINCNDEHICVTLEGYNQATTSLKCYIYPDGICKREQDKGNIDKKRDDYTKIFTQIIKNNSIWEEVKTLKETLDESKQEYKKSLTREVSIFDICRIQNNENAFSDALKHFMEQSQPKYIELWQKFFREVKFSMLDDQYNCKPLNIKLEDYCVAREEDISKNSPLSGRIDLVIRDKENIIVIENKIKSDINKIATDNTSTQLRRYYKYIEHKIRHEDKENQDYGKIPHYILLTPKYNIPEIADEPNEKVQMKDVYKIVTYEKLHKFIQEHISNFNDDRNFVDFHNAMFRHTLDNVNDYLYHDMMEKFINIIVKNPKQKIF